MRRLFVFLAVFGLGLALLLWFDRRHRESAPGVPVEQPALDEGEPQQPGPGASEAPLAPEAAPAQPAPLVPSGQDPNRIQFTAGGKLTLTSYDEVTGLKRLDFLTERLVDLGQGLFDANELTITLFDADAQGVAQPSVRVEAGRGRLRLSMAPEIEIEQGGRIELFDVTVSQLVGGALTPLVFRAPRLLGWIEEGRFESLEEDVARVEGRGLESQGQGLIVEGMTNRFRFERGGQVTLDLSRSETVTLFAPDGPLSVERIESARDEELKLVAQGGARVKFQGQHPSDVSGDELELFTRRVGEGVRLLSSGTVTGTVHAQRAADSFDGGRADLVFDERGQLAEIVLHDEPRVALQVPDETGQPTPVLLNGDGPLRVETVGATKFRLAGSCRISTPRDGLTITCTGGVEGSSASEDRPSTFDAHDEVVLTQGAYRLTTARLFLSVPGDQRDSFDARCDGRTIAVGPDAEGVEYEFVAEQGLELSKRGEDWLIPVARDVRIAPTGAESERSLTLGAIRDLDWGRQTFRGEEGVLIESEYGTGTATQIVVRGPQDLELIGSETQPAQLDLGQGRGQIRATRIHAYGRRIDLEGAARIDLQELARTWKVRCRAASLTIEEPPQGNGEPATEARSSFLFEALDVSEAVLTELVGTTTLSSDRLEIPGSFLGSRGARSEGGQAARDVEGRHLTATGHVSVAHVGRIELHGQGGRFELYPDGRALLLPDTSGRINCRGHLEDAGLPFKLTGDDLEYRAAIITVRNPHVSFSAVLLPISPINPPEGFAPIGERLTEAYAKEMLVDRTGITLKGSARLIGQDVGGVGLTVQAERVKLAGEVLVEGEQADPMRGFQAIDVSGGFVAHYAQNAMARGSRMYATQENVHIEGEPAQVKVAGLSMESAMLDVNLETYLVTAPRGILRATGDQGEWSFAFASMTPVEEDAEDMIIFGAPVYQAGPSSGARAEWAVMWIHADSWRERASSLLWDRENAGIDRRVEMPLPVVDLLPNVFRSVADQSFGRYARAVYLEGGVEMTELGTRVARAEAIYLDLMEAQGWMRESEIVFQLDVGSKNETVRARADELRTASDGSLRANRATLTTCNHEQPHYVVETNGLRLEPRSAGGWRVSAENNMLRFSGGAQVPLPPFGDAVLDPKGGFEGFETEDEEVYEVDRLGLGSTARFGTSIGAGIRSDIGSVGRRVGSLFGFDPTEVSGRWDLDGSYHGSRGLLFDVGLKLSERSKKAKDERFWLHLYSAGISENQEDRGIIRVDPEDRPTYRSWNRARGRYPTGEKSWIDLAFTTQSDPGVQAEFFQNRFLNWEERDNYLHWRKGTGSDLLTAEAKFRVDDYRTEVERRPSLGYYHGERELFKVATLPFLYGAHLDVENLRRKPGDPLYERSFLDANTGRSALRADTRHRVEVPISTGVAAIVATPFVEGRLTAWDEGFETEQKPYRGALLGGVELSSTFWKQLQSGFMNDLTPSARLTRDVAYSERNGEPILFDEVENSLEGSVLDLGLRTRWWKPGTRRQLDLEMRGINKTEQPDDIEDSWELLTLGSYYTDIGSWPVAITHDGRENLDESRTLFSRTRLGFSPSEPLDIELGYTRGATLDERLFEAATIQARWTINPKWEIQGRETIKVNGGGSYNTSAVLRRYSHDYFLELGTDYQEGEGSSVTITWRPLLGYRKRPLGLIRR